MPQIYKMEFKPVITEITERKRVLKSLRDQMYGCICQHLDSGHFLCVGKCYYDNCDCKEFKSLEVMMEIIITNADIYEFENPDHEIRDSFGWWNDFILWRQRNERECSI